MIVTMPSASRSSFEWSILMVAPLRIRSSWMVSPPLPISALICGPLNFSVL